MYCVDKETKTICKVKEIQFCPGYIKVVADAVNPESGKPNHIAIPLEDVTLLDDIKIWDNTSL